MTFGRFHLDEGDVRDVLPSVQAPTLVIHRTGDRALAVEGGRYLAAHIPGAMMIELPGDDHLPFVGAQEEILDPIERFLTTLGTRACAERVLATALTVLPAAGAAVEELRPLFAAEVAAQRGRMLSAARASLAARAGIHIGECDPSTAAGPLFSASADLAAAAAPGEVVVSRTVIDLVHGSGLCFRDQGAVALSSPGRSLSALVVQ